MEAAYQPELWQNLYIALCSASAALTGLLFISTSLHVEEVMNTPTLRTRATGSTTQSTIMIIEAAVVLLPQSYSVIGFELFILNLATLIGLPGRVTFLSIRGTYHPRQHKLPDYAPLACVWLIYAVGTVGGLSLWLKGGGGFYLITAQCLLNLGFVVTAAWSVMVDVGREAYREAA